MSADHDVLFGGGFFTRTLDEWDAIAREMSNPARDTSITWHSGQHLSKEVAGLRKAGQDSLTLRATPEVADHIHAIEADLAAKTGSPASHSDQAIDAHNAEGGKRTCAACGLPLGTQTFTILCRARYRNRSTGAVAEVDAHQYADGTYAVVVTDGDGREVTRRTAEDSAEAIALYLAACAELVNSADDAPYTHAIVCPDGTEWGRYPADTNVPVSAEVDRLNAAGRVTYRVAASPSGRGLDCLANGRRFGGLDVPANPERDGWRIWNGNRYATAQEAAEALYRLNESSGIHEMTGFALPVISGGTHAPDDRKDIRERARLLGEWLRGIQAGASRVTHESEAMAAELGISGAEAKWFGDAVYAVRHSRGGQYLTDAELIALAGPLPAPSDPQPR